MKIITLWEPWATFIAFGWKSFETRSWGTSYRGSLAIHAAKRPIDGLGLDLWWKVIDELKIDTEEAPLAMFHYGSIIATATVTDCFQMSSELIKKQSSLERMVGDWQVGRFGWQLEGVKRLAAPIPVRGAQGLRNLDPSIACRLSGNYVVTGKEGDRQ